MEHLFTSESIISFIILAILEVVLGIDNVIFVSIIMNRLKDKSQQKRARRIWMITGIISRSLLLMALGWLLDQRGKYIIPESWLGKGFDLASIVMLGGGLFLIYKSVKEIHGKLEGEDPNVESNKKSGISLPQAIVQIMIAAVVVAMIVMFLFSPAISGFVHKHPTIKMLALSFLVMIGLSLVIEGWDHEQSEKLHLKNYIYFGMAFSFTVEMLNMTMRSRAAKKRRRVVELNEPVWKAEERNESDMAK